MDGHDQNVLNLTVGGPAGVRETDGRGGGMEEWRKGEKAEKERKGEGWENNWSHHLFSWQSLPTRACLTKMIHVVSVVKG